MILFLSYFLDFAKKKDDLILPFTLISSTQYYSDREYLLTGNFGGIEGGIFISYSRGIQKLTQRSRNRDIPICVS